MNITLWVVAVVLAVMFVMAGIMKTTRSREQLIAQFPWVESFPTPVVRFIGTAELLGAIGLVGPAATGIAPVLTPLAATGLALTMVGAIITHTRRKDGPQPIVFNVVLLAASVFVAWGRFGPYAF
jgi:uncharacterized membrane protein YphA (DoxX/SURF4 family)